MNKKKILLTDLILLLLIVTIVTCMPQLYKTMEHTVGRLIWGTLLIVGIIVLTVILIVKIVRRNRTCKIKGVAWVHFTVRIIAVLTGIWIFADIMVATVHPSVTGIYAIEMSRANENKVLVLNSIFFVLYSQGLITIFTGMEEKTGEFIKRLFKTWVYAIIPVFIITLLCTFLGELISDMDTGFTYPVNIIFTTLLWFISIVINERIKRGQKNEKTA